MRDAWQVGRLFGIPLRIHVSWLIVFGLVSWSLAAGYFPAQLPDLPVWSYWTKAIIAAAMLFVSVILHELTHKEFGAPDTFYYRDFDLSNNAIADGRVRVPGVGLLEVNLFETPALMWNADTYEELYHKWYVQ